MPNKTPDELRTAELAKLIWGPRKRRLILAGFVVVMALSLAAWVYMLRGFGVKLLPAVLITLGLVGVWEIVKAGKRRRD